MIKPFSRRLLAGTLVALACAVVRAQPHSPIAEPDPRYKADILLIVAHPDDDTAVSTYLARAVLDEGKRAAVIFTTRGNSGPNAVGMEQSKSLAAVREMEARRSLAERGITNVWFLDGQDTPTQDVLHSLETLGHGSALESAVRLIRLTRPEVILTWLPAYVAGENHGDHQASAVVAVEAFDQAADPTAFAEQLTAPRWHGGVGNYGEGLRPWQAKKIYFFSDASHPDFLKGHGPTYLASDMCKARNMTFAEINRLAWKQYATQVDFDEKTLSGYVNMPEYLILGKSLVQSKTLDDVWTGVAGKAVSFAPAPGYRENAKGGVTLELGGPWAFYRQFYPAHGLQTLETLVPAQTALSYGNQLWVPLLLRNDSPTGADVTLHAALPAGWAGDTKEGVYHLEPHSQYPVSLFLTSPAAPGDKLQNLSWTIEGAGVTAPRIELAVYMEFDGVSQ
ncbi:MAG TPA: PIG-L family deacetylase [Terracidiphilus sp.]